MKRGYFEIGMFQPKTHENLGTLWRSAYQLGAAGIFTIGRRYQRQASDTLKAWRHVPLRNYESFEQFHAAMPHDCPLVAVEMGGTPLPTFRHPQRAIYLLGSEDSGLPPSVLAACHQLVSLPSVNANSYNVAVAGSLVMFHRNYLQVSV